MGRFDDNGNLLDFDDDSSPFDGLAPAIRGRIPDNGTLHLKISGIGDDNFDGLQEYYEYYCEDCPETPELFPHYEEGNYRLAVLVGDAELPGDIDFFTLSGLTPGDVFTVSESFSSYFGIRIGWLANNGSVIALSNYSDLEGREQIAGIVPPDGQVNLVVSGYDDVDLRGRHAASGDYLLTVETRAAE
ncbi:MAG: hypothetical protein F6K42_39110 [Leptolyngbya sp. SIO1D8]|nr:hypothetical protein [Leptolyngbya sp. SIO1D8]